MAIPVWVQYLVLALLAPILLLSGRAAQLLRLPLITGYVLAGIILGPYGLTVLDAASLQSLTAVRSFVFRSVLHWLGIRAWLPLSHIAQGYKQSGMHLHIGSSGQMRKRTAL